MRWVRRVSVVVYAPEQADNMAQQGVLGAKIANLTDTGQNGEQPQIDQMTPGSQLVTVTIGAGWRAAVQWQAEDVQDAADTRRAGADARRARGMSAR